jgi:hypothetical protein
MFVACRDNMRQSIANGQPTPPLFVSRGTVKALITDPAELKTIAANPAIPLYERISEDAPFNLDELPLNPAYAETVIDFGTPPGTVPDPASPVPVHNYTAPAPGPYIPYPRRRNSMHVSGAEQVTSTDIAKALFLAHTCANTQVMAPEQRLLHFALDIAPIKFWTTTKKIIAVVVGVLVLAVIGGVVGAIVGKRSSSSGSSDGSVTPSTPDGLLSGNATFAPGTTFVPTGNYTSNGTAIYTTATTTLRSTAPAGTNTTLLSSIASTASMLISSTTSMFPTLSTTQQTSISTTVANIVNTTMTTIAQSTPGLTTTIMPTTVMTTSSSSSLSTTTTSSSSSSTTPTSSSSSSATSTTKKTTRATLPPLTTGTAPKGRRRRAEATEPAVPKTPEQERFMEFQHNAQIGLDQAFKEIHNSVQAPASGIAARASHYLNKLWYAGTGHKVAILDEAMMKSLGSELLKELHHKNQTRNPDRIALQATIASVTNTVLGANAAQLVQMEPTIYATAAYESLGTVVQRALTKSLTRALQVKY